MAKAQGEASQPYPSYEQEQAPQSPCDRHGPGYDNDTLGWVRGQGQNPNFDKKKPGK